MTVLDALQTTLSAEHAAVFALGYLGAQTSASAAPGLHAALTEAYAVHRTRRDELTEQVREAGGEPVAAAASYDLPDVGGDAGVIASAALRVERRCGTTYGFLVASTPPGERDWALGALLDSATRELALGGVPRPLPGR